MLGEGGSSRLRRVFQRRDEIGDGDGGGPVDAFLGGSRHISSPWPAVAGEGERARRLLTEHVGGTTRPAALRRRRPTAPPHPLAQSRRAISARPSRAAGNAARRSRPRRTASPRGEGARPGMLQRNLARVEGQDLGARETRDIAADRPAADDADAAACAPPSMPRRRGQPPAVMPASRPAAGRACAAWRFAAAASASSAAAPSAVRSHGSRRPSAPRSWPSTRPTRPRRAGRAPSPRRSGDAVRRGRDRLAALPAAGDGRALIGAADSRPSGRARSWSTRRGPALVDEAALIAALDDGRLATYAADVFGEEPPRSLTSPATAG